jgi:hypothetical protein
MEIFNECCIITASYHLFLFTDFVDTTEMQYDIGWSLIGITVVNILVNMLVMIWMTVKQLNIIFKKLWARCKEKLKTKKSA